jgi:hypothetical protein
VNSLGAKPGGGSKCLELIPSGAVSEMDVFVGPGQPVENIPLFSVLR